MTRHHSLPTWSTAWVLLFAAAQVLAQSNPPVAVHEWTTAEDHQNMLMQLGITKLRPGPSGKETDSNFANIDEAKANRFPQWPDLLTLTKGIAVTTAEQWWKQRRPEIVEAFERDIIGRIPAKVPAVQWSLAETANGKLGAVDVSGQHLLGHVDNSSYPAIDVNIDLTLVLPKNTKGPVPVMIIFGGRKLAQAVGNEAVPSFGPPGAAPVASDPPAGDQLVAAGWGVAYLNPTSVQADNGAGLTKGIIGLVNKGKPRKPDDWGALRAWSWAAARALDHFETDAAIDAKRVGIDGVSRYGKAALVTMAFEPRFAVVLIGSSGEGGASPYRRDFGEMVENLTGSGEYHWMAGNFLKYGTAESSFGSMNASNMAVDSHMLIALCAPRPTFVSYGVPEKGDALWLDQQGSYMATVAAGKVFKLLGVKDLGTNENYRTAKMPPVNKGLLDGELAWRQHDGGHTDGPNWKYFIPWASRELKFSASPAIAQPRADANSEAAHRELIAKAHSGTIDVYFIGDSITRRWGALDYPDLLANWSLNFHGWNAADFAWGGDRTQNMLWRLENGEFEGVHPKVIAIQAGTNNLGDVTGDQAQIDSITAGVKALIDSSRAKAPAAAIVVTGLFLRSDKPQYNVVIKGINSKLAAMADGKKLRFVDINEKLADANGQLAKEMSVDGLHLSARAYQLWADALAPVFTALMGPPAATDQAPPATGDPSVNKG